MGSFFEIMLGAEPFMLGEFGMVMGWEDLDQVWPSTRAIIFSTGENPCDPLAGPFQKFTPQDFWPIVRAWFDANVTGALCQQATASEIDARHWNRVLHGAWTCA